VASLDDILGLADDLPTSRQSPIQATPSPAATAARPSADATPSWLFPKPAATAPAPATAAATPTATPAPDATMSPASARQPASTGPTPFFNGTGRGQPANGSAQPASTDSPIGPLDRAPAEPVTPSVLSIDDLLADTAPTQPIAGPSPSPAAAKAAVAPSPARASTPSQPTPASAAKAAPQQPKAQDAVTKPAASAAAPVADAQPAPASEPVMPLAATAGLAAIDSKDVKPAIPAAKPAQSEPQATMPVLMGTPLTAPVPVSAKAVAAPMGGTLAMTAIEERVVELLRPMIREWLDNNMPRMIERALSIELASSVKPKSPMAKN